MSTRPLTAPPSSGFAPEADAFFASLEAVPPESVTACQGWTAHEITAHLAAVGLEVAINLEAYGDGEVVPDTRGFEEREAPFRALNDVVLRAELPICLDRMATALDSVLEAEPDAVVPWTGRQMVVKTFITHLRSEFSLHRWDLVGDDETSTRLLGQAALTEHAISVLSRALVAKGAAAAPPGLRMTIASPGAADVELVVDADGPHLSGGTIDLGGAEPAVVADPAARLLTLWGRRPGDPGRLRAPLGSAALKQLQSVLAGY